jgi:leucyl-tRNA synthetase
VEWKEDSVFHYRARTRKVLEMFMELRDSCTAKEGPMDSWLISVLYRDLNEATGHFEAGRLREASNLVYFTFPGEIRWAQKRGGVSKGVMDEALSVWAKLLQPVTPHLAEELWEALGGEGFVSKAPWPSIKASRLDERALQREDYIELLLSDLANIRKMTGIEPRTMYLYTASDWKWSVLDEMVKGSRSGDGRLDQGTVIKSLMSRPELSEHKKNVPQLVGRLSKDVVKMGDREKARLQLLRDERELLQEIKSFLSSEMGCEVKVFSDDQADRYDPMGKSKGAVPLKPAIFME